jgi:hypothetical protein
MIGNYLHNNNNQAVLVSQGNLTTSFLVDLETILY